MRESFTDCRSEIGITVGLIDSIIAAANALKSRSLDDVEILEAISDLQSNETLRALVFSGPLRENDPCWRRRIEASKGIDHEKLQRVYEIDAFERCMSNAD